MKDKYFFKKYQKQLLWFVNTSLGRRYFRISDDIPRDKHIVKFCPNSFTWIDGYDFKRGTIYKTDFRVHSKFAKRINYSLAKLNFFFKYWKIPFKTENEWVSFPLFIIAPLTITTFYPDPNPESTSVDGRIGNDALTTNWAGVRDTASGNIAQDTIVSGEHIFLETDASSNWRGLFAGFYLFDTSPIGASNYIDSAILSVYGTAKSDNFTLTAAQSAIHLVSSNPASSTALATADFSTRGSTSFGSVAYADWNIAGYNDITLNLNGRNNISLTGISKFASRSGADLNNSEPTVGVSKLYYMSGYFADQAGTSNDPKLVVTHFIGFILSETMSITESVSVTNLVSFVLTETVNITESILATMLKVFTITSNISISEAISIIPRWVNQIKNAVTWTNRNKS